MCARGTLHLLLLHVRLLLLAERRLLVLVRLVAHRVGGVGGRLGIVRRYVRGQCRVHAQLEALECEECTAGLICDGDNRTLITICCLYLPRISWGHSDAIIHHNWVFSF